MYIYGCSPWQHAYSLHSRQCSFMGLCKFIRGAFVGSVISSPLTGAVHCQVRSTELRHMQSDGFSKEAVR
jgi:hypothetical protein